MAKIVRFSQFQEGEVFDADSLNDRFKEVQYAVNATHEDSTDRGCFNWHHIPSLCLGPATASGPLWGDLEAIQSVAATIATFEDSGIIFPSFVPLDSNGTTGSGITLSLILDTATNPNSQGPIFLKSSSGDSLAGGVLVMADIYVVRLGGKASGGGAWYTNPHEDNCFAARLEIRETIDSASSSTTWTGLNRTLRFVQEHDLNYGDQGGSAPTTAPVNRKQNICVPLRALVTSADLTGSNVAIDSVRIGISLKRANASHPVAAILGHVYLSAIPLRSGLETSLVDGS